MLELNAPLPHEKPKLADKQKVKEFTQSFVEVLQDMPEANYITKKKLSDTVEKAGNIDSNKQLKLK